MMERLKSILHRMGVLHGTPISNDQKVFEECIQPVLWLEAPELEQAPDARRLAVLEQAP